MQPRYPIYIPSRGRHDVGLTAKFLMADGVAFRVVVEKQEFDLYAQVYGADRLLVLPESNRGLPYARNWILDHARTEGHARHWQIDDNIRHVARVYKTRRIKCASGPAFRATEDFVDRFDNVGLAGLNYDMFAARTARHRPFALNVHVYSCMLLDCSIPFRFRGKLNEDVDMCLQVLSNGLCTVQMNAFVIHKLRTMTLRGGNADLYKDKTRTIGVRELCSRWPGVVVLDRRFGRAHFKVKGNWTQFTTPLRRREGVVVSDAPNEYGLTLTQSANVIRSDALRELLEHYHQEVSSGTAKK